MVAVSWILPGIAASQAVTTKSAEVAQLQFYVGDWNEAGEMRDDPSKPFKAISGSETCRWTAGGYAVMCEEKTTGPGGGWEGVYILSYDSVGKQYHVHGTEKPGMNMHAVGQLDGSRWIWLTDPAPDGSRVRYIFAQADAGARTLTVDVGAGDQWATIVNIKYMSRK